MTGHLIRINRGQAAQYLARDALDHQGSALWFNLAGKQDICRGLEGARVGEAHRHFKAVRDTRVVQSGRVGEPRVKLSARRTSSESA